jgi:hypothetical protein
MFSMMQTSTGRFLSHKEHTPTDYQRLSVSVTVNYHKFPAIAHCGGAVYANPSIGPEEIISLAAECGLRIKKMVLKKPEDCEIRELISARERTLKDLRENAKILLEVIDEPSVVVEPLLPAPIASSDSPAVASDEDIEKMLS